MKRILVVDDSSTMRKMIIASLQGLEGVTFGQAGNGLEAIEQLALETYDLMVLDLNMPELHGLEVLQFVLGHRDYHAIPIVILTTKGDEKSRGEAIEAGAACYLTKPFEPSSLSSQICDLLNHH